jgi:multiple sugar transport system ATP-binding protein
VMRNGRLQQLAPPGEVYASPANLFVARFCGSPPMNVLDGAMEGGRFKHAAGEVPVADAGHSGPVKLGFRPENAEMTAPGEAGSLDGEVYVVEPLGNETLIAITIGDTQVNVRAPAGFEPPVGERCGVRPDPGRLHLFNPETEAAISTAAGNVPAAGDPNPEGETG